MAASPTIHKVFQAAAHSSGVNKIPWGRATVSKLRPIQKSNVKLSHLNTPGCRMTVERNRVVRGRTTLTANTMLAAPVAGSRHFRKSATRFIAPFEPTVTNRFPSLTRRASINSEIMTIKISAPASTAATPFCRDEMFLYSDVARTSYCTGIPKTYATPNSPRHFAKTRIVAETRDGRIRGRTIRHVTRNLRAPSILAESLSCESNRRRALPKSRMTKEAEWSERRTMIGNSPYESQSGGSNPRVSSHPDWPPTLRFLNRFVHASANVHAGSMYGTISAVANHRRPHKLVRLSNHAIDPPISNASMIEPTAIVSVFRSGRQNMSVDTGDANTLCK